METLKIAGTGLKASRIGLGTWAISGWMWGGSDEQAAIATIHAVIDPGITLIDTAPVYGFGRSEEIVGGAVADGGRRHQGAGGQVRDRLDRGRNADPQQRAHSDHPRGRGTRCAGSAPTTSTFIRCTGPIYSAHRGRRRSRCCFP